MRAVGLAFILLFGQGCRSTVRLEVPAVPAVRLPVAADAIAVVAYERSCQDPADVLVQTLADGGFLRVDPRSDLRIELFNCDDDQQWVVEQVQSAEGARSRTRVHGRAHAVAAVSYRGKVLANLIGAGRAERSGTWGQPTPLVATWNGVRRHAMEDLATDLATQLNPLGTLAERRVYPNAPAGSAKELTTRAVRAELDGDLDAAVTHAEAAWQVDPNARTTAYLEELRRLRTRPR